MGLTLGVKERQLGKAAALVPFPEAQTGQADVVVVALDPWWAAAFIGSRRVLTERARRGQFAGNLPPDQ